MNYNIELRTDDRVWETLHMVRDNLDDLRIEMAKFIGELLREHADRIWKDQEWRMDVTDESGLILYVMHLTATDSVASTSRDPQPEGALWIEPHAQKGASA